MPHCLESRSCSSHFQVREARTFLSDVVAVYSIFEFTILDEILCCCGCMGCLDFVWYMYMADAGANSRELVISP